MLRYIHKPRPQRDDPSLLALAQVLVDMLRGENGLINEELINALPISYTPALRRSHLAIGPVVPDSFDGVTAMQSVPQLTQLCEPLVFLRGVLDLVYKRARRNLALRKVIEDLDGALIALGVSDVPDLPAMRGYRSDKDPLLAPPKHSKRTRGDTEPRSGRDPLAQLRKWCHFGEHIVAHATFLQRLERAPPADASLLTRIEWFVPLPYVWESYVKLQLRERFKNKFIGLGAGRIKFSVIRGRDIPHRFFPSRMARPDVIVWAEHGKERRPVAIFDAKLYNSASRKAVDAHYDQVTAYASALERQYRPTSWWRGQVAVCGLVYGYWKAGEPEQGARRASGLKWYDAGTEEPRPGKKLNNTQLVASLQHKSGHVRHLSQGEWDQLSIPELRLHHFIQVGDSYFQPSGRDWTENCYHIDLRGDGVVRRIETVLDGDGEEDGLIECTFQQITQVINAA